MVYIKNWPCASQCDSVMGHPRNSEYKFTCYCPNSAELHEDLGSTISFWVESRCNNFFVYTLMFVRYGLLKCQLLSSESNFWTEGCVAYFFHLSLLIYTLVKLDEDNRIRDDETSNLQEIIK